MMQKGNARILIVDYEREVVRALRRELVAHQYDVLTAFNGERALELLDQHRPDLVLLDFNLPGISGLEVCAHIRTQSNLPPIIVISARGTQAETVRAFELGIDDYLAKPFDMPELLARIRVALRHASSVPNGVEPRVTIGPLQVDLAQRRVWVTGLEIKLTPIEYDLLKIFLKNRGQILTQRMLLTQVWGAKHETHVHYLHVYIGHLRRKIEPDPLHPRLLHTLHGVGYRFEDEKAL